MPIRQYTDNDLPADRKHLKKYLSDDYLTAAQVAEVVSENSNIEISSSDIYNAMRYRKIPDRGYFGANGDVAIENAGTPRKRGQRGKQPRKYLYDDWRNVVISKDHVSRPFKPENEVKPVALRVRKSRAKKKREKEEAERLAATRSASGQ